VTEGDDDGLEWQVSPATVSLQHGPVGCVQVTVRDATSGLSAWAVGRDEQFARRRALRRLRAKLDRP